MVAAGVAALLAFGLLAIFEPGSEGFASAALNIYSNVVAAAGVFCAFFAAWRSRGRSRTGWAILGLSMLSWTIGDIAWMVYGLAGYVPPPYPGLPDIGYLVMPPLMIVGLVKLMIGDTWQQRLRRALVPTAIVLAILCVVWHYILLPQFHGTEASLLEKLVSAAYPATDIAVMVLALWAAFDNRHGAARVPLALLGIGLALLACGDITYSLISLNDGFSQGHWLDYLWIAALLVLAAAGASQARLRADYTVGKTNSRIARPWLMAAPLALVPLGVTFCAVLEITGDLRDDVPLMVLMVCLSLVATIEPMLALFVNERLNRNLSASMVDLERASRAKSEFLSRMSHELRTPMNAVLGFSQLLEMDDLTDEQRENVGYILSSGRHLLALIDEVLDIARIEAGRLDVSTAPFDAAELVNQAVEMNRPNATSAGIELRVESSGGPVLVSGDVQRTRQALLNLISNGVKYNRQQGSVAVAVDVVPGRAQITVTDTGPGIPAEKLHRLFEPFDRLDAEFTAVPGTGLGLALSKALVEAMGGTLTVNSRPGEGCAFTIELPLAVEAPGELPLAA